MTTVMVVDDQAIIREPIEAALRNAGYQTLIAAQGQQAIELCASHRVDIMVLDMEMPVLDGLELLRRLRANSQTKSIPVIALSAQAERTRVLEAVKLGICGYMLKSRFSLRQLLEEIAKHVERSDSPAEAQKLQSGEVDGPSSQRAGERAPVPNATRPEPRTDAGLCAGVRCPNNTPADATEGIRDLKPIITRSELTKLIDDAGELKGFSPAVAEVLKLTGNARCSIDQVAKAIGRDHAIALKILKLANSAVYTRGEPVDSVQQAVLRIGLGQIRQAVLNIAVVERFSGDIAGGLIESGQFWEHAIATGIISAEIAHARNEKDADGAFTMGLLHDVGKLVFAAQLGDAYKKVLETARDMHLPVEQVEHRMLCYNHADIMDRIFRQWKFGAHLINPIVFHHLSAGNIRKTAPKETVEVATLRLANRLAHAFMLGSSGNQTIYPTEDLCELLKLDPDLVAGIELIAREETDKVKFALLATSNQANWAQLREVHRQSLAQPLTPLYVSRAPCFDAHRIFFDQLASDTEHSQEPNLGVIHVRNVREREEVTEAYRTRELDAGAANLPLLIISPQVKIGPEDSLLEGRPHRHLSTPFVIARCIGLVNDLLSASRGKVELAAAA